MKRSLKIAIIFVLIILLIGAEAKQISDQKVGIQSYMAQAEENSSLGAALEPPRKLYSLKNLVLQLINATPLPALDTDGDGLFDSVERVIGTNPNGTDSDFDNLNDTFEVFNDLDPLEPDSNLDGYPDYPEVMNVYSLDIDNDGEPNAWDFDNDGDGVIDRLDESPNAKSNASSKFNFTLTTDGQPLIMTFQVRPADPSHLTLMDRSWDWPWDNESTMQDLDNSTRDLIMVPWLRLTCSTSAVPNQSAVTDYGMLVDSDGMEISLTSNREFGTVVALTGRIFHPAPPGAFSFDLELLWKVSGFSDVPAKALDAGAGIYLTTGSDGHVVANTTDEIQGLLQWIDLGENKVALMVPNGPLFSIASDGTLFANGTSLGDQESFEVVDQGGNQIGLKASNGKYVAVYDKVVVANSTTLIPFNLVDLGYYPEITQLVTYKDDFLLTGFSIEESYGSEIGLFYSKNTTQTIAANMLLDYVFLRNNATDDINAIPPLENISAILAAYNVTINVTTESYVNKYQAFLQTSNVLIPEVLNSLPVNLTLPLIICNEDHFKMVELSDTLTGPPIMGSSKEINLTVANLTTLKTMRTSFFNTSSLKILTFIEVVAEIESWNLADPNATIFLIAIFWKWTEGESLVTQINDVPMDFTDYITSLELVNSTIAAICIAGWDLLYCALEIGIIISSWRYADKVVNALALLRGSSSTWLSKTGKVAEVNFLRYLSKTASESIKSIKLIKVVKTATVILDVVVAGVLYGFKMVDIFKTAEIYRETIDENFADEYLANSIIVATFLYAIYITASIIIAFYTGGIAAIILTIFNEAFGFCLDYLIGAIVGWIMGDIKDDFHAEPDVEMEGAPEMTIYDKDNNGLDVGDRIEILTHLVGSVKGAGEHPALWKWSYIIPWISLVPPKGSNSVTSPNLEGKFTSNDWRDLSHNLTSDTNLNQTCTYSETTERVDRYDSSAWVEPGTPMINFPVRLQMNSRYLIQQRFYHWVTYNIFFDPVQCFHDNSKYDKTEASTITTLYYDVLPGSLASFLTWNTIKCNDRDGDGVNDTQEAIEGTDKFRFDTDADGLNDKYEIDFGTDPRNCDMDEDGLIDKYEFLYATNATNRDSDGDGIYDYLELAGWVISFNYSGQVISMLVVSNPALNDTDGDGLSDGMEYWSGLNPRSSDTNGDGIKDVAIPVLEIIALLQNSTDIQQLTHDIFNESCSIYEFAVDGNGSVYAAVIRPGYNDSVVVLDSNLTYFNNWTLSFKSGLVAVDRFNGCVYVSVDWSHDLFTRYNLSGANPVTNNFACHEWWVMGMDFDSSGVIYTAEEVINKFFPNGTPMDIYYGSIGPNPEQFKEIGSIAVEEKYGFIYALDGDGVTYPFRIMKFNKTDGAYITTLPNGYQHIVDFTVDSDGWVYVLDQFDPVLGEGCVRRFDHNGMEDRNFILTDVNNTHPWNLVHNPIRIEIDSEKNIYILEDASPEYPNPRLLKFSWNTTTQPPQIDNNLYEWDGDTLGNIYEDVIGWNVTFRNESAIFTMHVTSEPHLRDSDFDGLSDYEENKSRSNPRTPDTDGDGLSDLYEWLLGINLLDYDTDNDGLEDPIELLIGSNPFNESDTDHDGLSDLLEFQLNSTPTEIDTDFDGANDSQEYTGNSNLLVPDTDGDFMFDGLEYQLGTNVTDPDTDDDDLLDGDELIYSTDPLKPDTDWDNATDGMEVDLGLDPLNNDTDYDGLLDGIELEWGSNPFNNDTDYDGIGDADDPDTFFTFPASIVLAFDPDPLNNTAGFVQALNHRTNVTIVSLEAFKANYTTAPYIVLVGRPAAVNNTVGGLIYELMADAGSELTEMMANDSHKTVVRYSVWTSKQTVIVMSQAYPYDILDVFNLIKEKNVTIQEDSISAEFLTAPIIHSEHYNFGFALSGVDMVKTTDSEIAIIFDEWARPTVNVSRYDASNTPHALESGTGLNANEQPLGMYLEVVLIANNSVVENVQSALIKIYYRTADLDLDGDGYITFADIDENRLFLYYFNETAGLWQKLTTDLPWVIGMGINTTDIELYGEHYAGYIWVIVTHLSLYSVGGYIIGLPWWVLIIFAAVACIGVALYVRHVQRKRRKYRKAPVEPKIPKEVKAPLEAGKAEGQFIRPIRYLLKREHRQISPSELPNLPLDAISGLSSKDLPKFGELGINTIPELAETNFSKERGKGPSDMKLNHGISYAIDLITHAEEPGVYDEMMPLEEMLVKKYETTPGPLLANLDIIAIEGLSEGNAEKLRKKNINVVKDLAAADIAQIESAGLREWEAEKFSEFAKWIMEYSKVITEKEVMDNIKWVLQEKNLIITFDITTELGRSSSGKTILVANSHGGRHLTGTDLAIYMIAYKYPEKKEVKPRKKREMQNIIVTIEGNISKLKVNTELDFGASSSEKSVIVASSRGNKQIEGTEVFIGLNIYKTKEIPPKGKKSPKS